jgi:site-specific DNA-methyltransferase (adenine-specific)
MRSPGLEEGLVLRGHPGGSALLSPAPIGRDLLNTLYYGENLEVLQRFISSDSVDLIYLDPPFNKNTSFSVIFRDESGRTSDAQLASFEDYWHWGPTPAQHYEYLTNSALHEGRVPQRLSALVGALHSSIRPSPLLAYLVEMGTRLVELHRVLKPTGSLFFHCDPTASHYIKLILDAIFDPRRFVAEIIWKRTSSHNDPRRPGRIHDTLLYYSKTEERTWNPVHMPLDPGYVDKVYAYEDDRGRYRLADLTAPGTATTRRFEWRGVTPPAHLGWRYSHARLEKLLADGRIQLKKDGRPSLNGLKRYLDDSKGRPIQSIWTDIPNVTGISREKIGWPTQKPKALLERVIASASNPDDIVLDPFCGCGTAIEASVAQGRRWVGIDHSRLARLVIVERLAKIGVAVPVFWWPTELDGVREMAESRPDGRHRFEAWALTRLGAQPVRELGAKGADEGIDGRIVFTGQGGRLETILVSVKSGHVSSAAVRDLKGTMDRERAAMGLIFTLQEPTAPMVKELAAAGFYRSPIDGRQYPRIVVHTVRDVVVEGRLPELPTRFGVQPAFWPLPTISPAVRLRRPKRAAEERPGTPATVPADLSPLVRAPYVARRLEEALTEMPIPVKPRSPRTSRRGR